MTPERIEEIQKTTSYPNSVSVQQALLTVWNECEQPLAKENEELKNPCCCNCGSHNVVWYALQQEFQCTDCDNEWELGDLKINP